MNDIVWGVILMLGIGIAGTMWSIYYILRTAYLEIKK